MTQPFGEERAVLELLMINAALLLGSQPSEEDTDYPIVTVGEKRMQLIGDDHTVEYFTGTILPLKFRFHTFSCGILHGTDKKGVDRHGLLVVRQQFVKDKQGDRVNRRWFFKKEPIQYTWQTIPIGWMSNTDVVNLTKQFDSLLSQSSIARAI